MTKQPTRRWVYRLVAVGLAVVVAGYASGFGSVAACQSNAAATIARELGSREVFVLPIEQSTGDNYPGAETVLRRAGFMVRACTTSNDQFECFPWAGVAPGQVVGPFLVDVRWGFVAAPTSGRGTRTRYLAFFGLVFPILDLGGWVT